ncbi:hypothetical protein ACVBEH_07820 [Roseateles sp. GG27B]
MPPGTYQITALLGAYRRSYTMTLEPGTSFHLHLRLAMPTIDGGQGINMKRFLLRHRWPP